MALYMKLMLKMENALFLIWIKVKDQHKKNLPVNIGTISAKTLEFIRQNLSRKILRTNTKVKPVTTILLSAKADFRNSRDVILNSLRNTGESSTLLPLWGW